MSASTAAWAHPSPEFIFVYALMAAFHGWAFGEHTDGSLQASRYSTVTPCPECLYDQALGRVSLTVGEPVPTPGATP